MDPYLCISVLRNTYLDSWALWNPFSVLCYGTAVMLLTDNGSYSIFCSMRLLSKQLRRLIIRKTQLSKTILSDQSLPFKIQLLFPLGVRSFLVFFYCNHVTISKWKVLLMKWKMKVIGLCLLPRIYVFVQCLFPLAQFLREYRVLRAKPRVILTE